MRKIILITAVLLSPFPGWSLNNLGFSEEEARPQDKCSAATPLLPKGPDLMRKLKNQLSSFKKGEGSEEEIHETLHTLLARGKEIPLSLLNEVIQISGWERASKIFCLNAQESEQNLTWYKFYNSVSRFLKKKCQEGGWQEEATWMNKPMGFLQKAAYETSLLFQRKPRFLSKEFYLGLNTARKMRRIIDHLFPPNKHHHNFALEMMETTFYYPKDIRWGVMLVRLLPVLGRYAKEIRSQAALEMYFEGILMNSVVQHTADPTKEKLAYVKEIVRRSIGGLEGYDGKLDKILRFQAPDLVRESECPPNDPPQQPPRKPKRGCQFFRMCVG